MVDLAGIGHASKSADFALDPASAPVAPPAFDPHLVYLMGDKFRS